MVQKNNNTNEKKFIHLTYNERTQIDRWYNKEQLSKTEIARRLSKSVRTIRREINNNLVNNLTSELVEFKAYSPDLAQERYEYNKTGKGPKMILDYDKKLCDHIEKEILENKKSPEVIAYELRKELRSKICAKTIRNTIKKEMIFININPTKIIYKKEYVSKNKNKYTSRKVPAEKSIDYRPSEANERSECGHWEGDLVVGTQEKGKVLFTLTERKTREEIIVLLESKKASGVIGALDRLEVKYGEEFRDKFKTITFDNGSEFLKYKKMEKSINENEPNRTTVYYAHPYRSGERGSNENANRLIRRWFEKGKTMEHLTEAMVQQVEDWINNYPRAMFGYMSSIEYRESIAA